MGKTIYIDDGDALNIDRVIVNMPDTKWCKVLYSCDLIDEYEDRLNAEKVAMMEELQSEIEETVKEEELIDKKWANGLHYSEKIIQQKDKEEAWKVYRDLHYQNWYLDNHPHDAAIAHFMQYLRGLIR